MDITGLAPKPTTAPDRPKRGRTAGPNLFLDNNWLMDSYQAGAWYEVTVAGTVEEYEQHDRDGNATGRMNTKLTGDAATVQAMLRQAADLLGIGVAIVPTQATKTKVKISYLGQKRKEYTKRTGSDNTTIEM